MKKLFLLSVIAYAGLSFAGEPGSSSSSLEKRNTLAQLPKDVQLRLLSGMYYLKGDLGPIREEGKGGEFSNIRQILEEQSITHPSGDDDLLPWLAEQVRPAEIGQSPLVYDD